jgi:hypothetical protein
MTQTFSAHPEVYNESMLGQHTHSVVCTPDLFTLLHVIRPSLFPHHISPMTCWLTFILNTESLWIREFLTMRFPFSLWILLVKFDVLRWIPKFSSLTWFLNPQNFSAGRLMVCLWLKAKTEGSTLLVYTELRGELEHLKIVTRLINERFVSVMDECVILTLKVYRLYSMWSTILQTSRECSQSWIWTGRRTDTFGCSLMYGH